MLALSQQEVSEFDSPASVQRTMSLSVEMSMKGYLSVLVEWIDSYTDSYVVRELLLSFSIDLKLLRIWITFPHFRNDMYCVARADSDLRSLPALVHLPMKQIQQ